MSNDKRQPGYYRVKYKGNMGPIPAWRIMEWDLGHWYDTGTEEMYSDVDFAEIDPTPIDPNPAPQPTGQLTAEGLWDSYSRLIPATESECAPHDDIVVIEKDDFIFCVKEYAAQETAALRAELLKEKEQFKDYVTAAEHDEYELKQRIDEMYTAGEMAVKDTRIKELEEVARTLVEGRDERILKMHEKDARIAELENQITILSRTQSSAIAEMKRVEAQRDEAVNLLKQARSAISSIKLSMMAHPDHQDGSEFDDMTSKAQDMEDLINNRLVNYFKS